VQIELDEGELITISLAGGEHGACGASIWALLGQHVNKNRLGKVYATDTGFRLRDDTVRAPDVSFVRTERLEAVHRRGF
jgi:Uma2 family endonuclease